jgi:hypothetical protein
LGRNKRLLALLLFSVYLISCGIDEFYYLPQVPENNINTSFNTDATVILPPIPSQFYYADGYLIFYKIYISDHPTSSEITTQPEMLRINNALNSDFIALSSFTNPANQSIVTHLTTFTNRSFFELELEGEDLRRLLSNRGGNFSIHFPPIIGVSPFLSFTDGTGNTVTYDLFRNSDLNFEPDQLFFYSDELVEYTDTLNAINNDVSLRLDRLSGHAYVSMYLVAKGSNPVNFQTILSKPTHINIFKLSNAN